MGKTLLFSDWLQLIDIKGVTNQETCSTEICFIPITSIANVAVKLLALGSSGNTWFTGERAATFVKIGDRIEKIYEDIIKEPTRASDAVLRLQLLPKNNGCSVFVTGTTTEEIVWKGIVTIGSI